MSRHSAFKLLSLILLLSIAVQPIAPASAESPQPPVPIAAAVANPTAQPTPTATSPLSEAVRMGKWPAQVAASTGAIRPDVHGPQRTDPAEGIPTHAYSPFDERRNREHPCPAGGCEFETDHVLVKLAPDVDAGAVSDARAMTDDTTLNSTLSDAGVVRLEPLFPKAQAPKEGALIVTPNGERVAEPDLTRWYRAYLSPTTVWLP